MLNNAYKQYQLNSIMTATPQQLTLMLYNGAVKFSNKAIEALECKNIESAHKYNLRVQDIIVELRSSLDFKYPIARDMDQMYEVIIQLFIEANIEKNIEKLKGGRELLVEFKNLWEEIIKIK